MTTLLLLVIYIAFISLGIPDSLFGTAWPAIYSELTLPIYYVGCQFHPEFTSRPNRAQPLFQGLISAAHDRKYNK